jgi:hypothetical protein
MIHRAAVFTDFGGPQIGQPNIQQFQHRHCVSADVNEYTVGPPAIIQHAQSLSRQPVYVVEEENPATVIMNIRASQAQMERPTAEISCNTPGMTTPARAALDSVLV